ncbi:MAG: hypothetical protein HZA49_06265 [Planctomycetes bacterium]|nr:hypothetical protein [Planctomycetota bacterium]
MTHQTTIKLGLGIILSVAIMAGYGGMCYKDPPSGSSGPLFSTGILDTTFGTGGIVTTTVGSGVSPYAISLQADGQILVAGNAWNGASFDFAVVRYTITGTLDTAFGTNGAVTTTIGSSSEVNAMALQADGKSILAGRVNNGVHYNFALARYTITGTLDTTFGTGGVVTTTIGSSDDVAYALVLQADEKIIAAGATNNVADSDFAMVRYNTNGTLDTTFDTDGIVTTTIGSNYENIFALVLQPDGKIIAAGDANNGGDDDFALARYNTNGTLDTTFDTDGIVTTTIGSSHEDIFALALQTDGRILVTGSIWNGTNDDIVLVRYTAAGALDTTFGANGVVITIIGGGYENAQALSLQADGRILVAGRAWTGVNDDFIVVRYTAAGELDASFGADGIVTTDIGSGDDYAKAMTLQPDNKILVTGEAQVGGGFALVRYWR